MAYILIVDDNTDIQDILKIMLKQKGHSVNVATGRKSLMESLGNRIPDLLIMDILLSDYDGRKLCEEIKADARYKNIPIIISSASTEKLASYRDYCADDVLEKPFDIDTLVKKINTNLQLKNDAS